MMDRLMKNLLAVLLSGAAAASAFADLKVTYVGQGRYSCSGSTAECAQINSNNNRLEESNRREYQEEQVRAQRYFEENHRRDRETKRSRPRGDY